MKVTKEQIDKMVTSMITMEFGDRGTWGVNLTDLPQLIASLSLDEKKEFIERYLAKFREELSKLIMDPGMALSPGDLARSWEAFKKFNPVFAGGFHPDDQ